jgi:hypothetical protein
MKNNPKVYGKTIVKEQSDMQMQTQTQDRPARQMRKHYPSVAERIAESEIAYRNFKFTGAEEAFPNEPAMRTVDQYFPYAVGGELLVDSPVTERERTNCARKASVLKKLGYRYLIVVPDMDEYAAQEALEKE